MAYTKGPWKVSEHDNSTVVGSTGKVVAECIGYSNKATDPAMIAQGGREDNARLIAAAPDMAEALRECVAEMDRATKFDGNTDPFWRAKKLLAALRSAGVE